MTTSTFAKTITFDRESKDYRMELDGRLIGYARTKHEAEVTLDQVVREMLTHGDCATAEQLDGGAVCATCDGEGRIPSNGCGDQAGGWAETCPDCQGKVTHVAHPTPVADANWGSAPATIAIGQRFEHIAFGAGTVINITDDERLNVQVQFDRPSRYDSKFWFDTDEVIRPRAVTAQSIAIESKIVTCANCLGIHHIQACPELRDHLRASDTDWRIAVGRKLCAMVWRDHAAFVALLLSVSPDQLIVYAQSYQAFIKDHNQRSDLTINDVIQVWRRMMSGDRGPAEMAMQAAA